MSAPSFDDRLDVERRLLAALCAWPHMASHAAGLEPQHFVALAHAELFAVIKELGEALLLFPLDARTIAQIVALVERDEMAQLFRSVGGVAKYVNEIIESAVLATDVPDLVATVRTCVRCGK